MYEDVTASAVCSYETTCRNCCPKLTPGSTERRHATRAPNKFARIKLGEVSHTTCHRDALQRVLSSFSIHPALQCRSYYFAVRHCLPPALFSSTLILFSSCTLTTSSFIFVPLLALYLAILEIGRINNAIVDHSNRVISITLS